MKSDWLSGWVMRLQSGFYTIRSEQGVITCQLRGRLKRGRWQGDVLAVGDEVKFTLLSDHSGVIESIEPRHSALVRLDPTPRGVYRQILLANPDQIMLVFSCANPSPHLRMLDRFLVITEKEQLPAVLVANKIDLVGLEAARATFAVYERLGYPVVYTSAESGLGVEELKAYLLGKVSALAGPSGVGKSSLLNVVQPGLGACVREVSQALSKGRHTTVVREMFALDGGGFVADLPGLRSLALWDTEPEEIDGYFRELRPLVEHCQFNDCTHRSEPGCAVRAAVEDGSISAERYQSYLNLRYGEE
jgi:ribosome biogenesis GTPase / thiamine phosphate phosphatase